MKHTQNALSQPSSVFLNLILFIACEMIVVCHVLTKYQPVFGEPSFRLGSTIGGVAVLLFFVLSGLLICYSLINKLKNPKYGFRSFFVDRFSRIYSGLVPALLLSAVFSVVIYLTNYSYYQYLSSMQSPPSLLSFGMTLFMLERFPVDFFNSILAPLGLTFPLPSVTPFGFNGILWTLVVEWWIYMAFGWFTFGLLALIGKRKKGKAFRVLFFIVAVILSLVLIGFMQEFNSLIIVWFVSALMMLIISNKTAQTKLSNQVASKGLVLVSCLSLVSSIFIAYTAFAYTSQYYDVILGLILSTFVFVSILFLNINHSGKVANWLQNRRIANWTAVGAKFSYTLFLTHYPIIIFLSSLNLPINQFFMMLPILLITNLTAFLIAFFTERRYKDLSNAIKRRLSLY